MRLTGWSPEVRDNVHPQEVGDVVTEKENEKENDRKSDKDRNT